MVADVTRIDARKRWPMLNTRADVEAAIEKAFAYYTSERPENGCWEWAGKRHTHGYGLLSAGKSRALYAHRVSYELHVGQIPDGVDVLHHCDNPPCIRPDHLFIGTHQDNMDDMVAKGRNHRPQRRLSDEQVLAIRAALTTGRSQASLAREYHVTEAALSAVARGWYPKQRTNREARAIGLTTGPIDLTERFWSKVHKTATCWFWQGGTKRGFGRVVIVGRPLKCKPAHLFSYELHFGLVKAKTYIRQSCGNRLCVRPEHLVGPSSAGAKANGFSA